MRFEQCLPEAEAVTVGVATQHDNEGVEHKHEDQENLAESEPELHLSKPRLDKVGDD